jgi:hypothetical protein
LVFCDYSKNPETGLSQTEFGEKKSNLCSLPVLGCIWGEIQVNLRKYAGFECAIAYRMAGCGAFGVNQCFYSQN